jgi:hypothetical protein
MLECSLRGEAAKFGCGVFRGESPVARFVEKRQTS